VGGTLPLPAAAIGGPARVRAAAEISGRLAAPPLKSRKRIVAALVAVGCLLTVAVMAALRTAQTGGPVQDLPGPVPQQQPKEMASAARQASPALPQPSPVGTDPVAAPAAVSPGPTRSPSRDEDESQTHLTASARSADKAVRQAVDRSAARMADRLSERRSHEAPPRRPAQPPSVERAGGKEGKVGASNAPDDTTPSGPSPTLADAARDPSAAKTKKLSEKHNEDIIDDE